MFASPHVLPEDRRRVEFAALVEAEDKGTPVRMARECVAFRFGISPEQMRSIEREGLDQHWPPLWPAGR
jgi:hypothetical protein